MKSHNKELFILTKYTFFFPFTNIQKALIKVHYYYIGLKLAYTPSTYTKFFFFICFSFFICGKKKQFK